MFERYRLAFEILDGCILRSHSKVNVTEKRYSGLLLGWRVGGSAPN